MAQPKPVTFKEDNVEQMLLGLPLLPENQPGFEQLMHDAARDMMKTTGKCHAASLRAVRLILHNGGMLHVQFTKPLTTVHILPAHVVQARYGHLWTLGGA